MPAMSAPSPPAPGRGRFVAAAALSCAVWAGFALGLPFGVGPDEPSHAAYGGFLQRHGRLPDAAQDVVFQAQHPPLYYAYLAVLAAVRPDAVGDAVADAGGDPAAARALFERRRTAPAAWELPYPRRIAWAPERPVEDPFAPFPEAALAAGETVAPAYTSEGFLLFVRACGGVFLLAAIFALYRAARGADADGTTLAAAAAVVVVPQFAATFAFVNSDQFAMLFSTLAFATLVAPTAAPLAETRRPLVAGLLLGLALASKLFAAGACVACGVFVLASEGAPLRRRLRAVVVMAAAAAVLGLPWVVRQFALGVGVDPVAGAGMRAPLGLKPYEPSFGWCAEFAAGLWRLWFSSVGGNIVDGGHAVALAAAAFALLACAGGAWVACGRGFPRRDRAACAAFLAGLVVQLALVAAANSRFNSPQGRYLHAVTAPGVFALAAAARALAGPRARGLLGALACAAALAALWIQHGLVLPAEHPARTPHDDAIVAYADAGGAHRDARAALLAGTPTRLRDVAFPSPADDALVDFVEVAVRMPNLEPGRPYVAEVRLGRVLGCSAPAVVCWNGTRIGGPFTAEIDDGWLRAPFVAPPPLAEGSRLSIRPYAAGRPVALAEARVRRADFAAPTRAPRVDGSAAYLIVAANPSAPPSLAASFDGAAPAPLAFDAEGRAFLTPPPGPAPRTLALFESESAVAALKPLALTALDTSTSVRGSPRATGFAYLAVAGADGRTPVCPLQQAPYGLPSGTLRVVAYDGEGVPVRPGIFAWAVGDALRDAADAALDVPPAQAAPREFARLLLTATSGSLDRIEFRGRPTYLFALPAEPR
jgi:hypothetical protein